MKLTDTFPSPVIWSTNRKSWYKSSEPITRTIEASFLAKQKLESQRFTWYVTEKINLWNYTKTVENQFDVTELKSFSRKHYKRWSWKMFFFYSYPVVHNLSVIFLLYVVIDNSRHPLCRWYWKMTSVWHNEQRNVR